MNFHRIVAYFCFWASLAMGLPSVSRAILRCETLAEGTDFLERRLALHEQAATNLRQGEERLIPEIVKALREGNWNSEILDPMHTPQDAVLRATLAAYRADQIHLEQFSTVLLRWEAFGEFNPNPINKVPFQALDERGHLTEEAEHVFLNDKDYEHALDKKQKKEFERLLAEAPLSERFFWRINIPTSWLSGRDAKRWAPGFNAARIRKDLSFFFGRPKKKNGKKEKGAPVRFDRGTYYYYGEFQEIIVPSFSILQSFLLAKFGPEAVRLHPELGETNELALFHGISIGGRVMAFHFPEIMGLTEPDGIPMGRFFSSIHDFDHAFKGSEAPAAYRWLVAHCARVLMMHAEALKKSGPVNSSRTYALTNLIDHVVESVLDLYLPSHDYPDKRFGARLYKDFGEYEPELLEILKEDMRKNAQDYLDKGLIPADLIEAMESPS